MIALKLSRMSEELIKSRSLSPALCAAVTNYSLLVFFAVWYDYYILGTLGVVQRS
jgi:hypothetical protein